MYKYLLFDLDGTISDSSPGITRCIQLALKELGINEERDKLKKFIGPPLSYSFKTFYGFSDEQIDIGTKAYRAEYSKAGKYENNLYPGMKELLHDLKSDGRILLLASSKPRLFVEDILAHFDIKDCFSVIGGSEMDGSKSTKLAVINDCLTRQFGAIPKDLSDCVMIGDTRFDLEAASQISLPTIAVSYGFGTYEEIEKYNPGAICDSVDSLRKKLFE